MNTNSWDRMKKQLGSKALGIALVVLCSLMFQCSLFAANKVTPPSDQPAVTQKKQDKQAALSSVPTAGQAQSETAPANNIDEEAFVEDEDFPVFSDPNENFNRVMFSFNDKLDAVVLKPIATVYNKILPKPINEGITNFFNNIRTLPTIANDVLQLHLYQAVHDTWRLAINTTIGVGGLFDMATRMGLEPYTNDFGLTLARWGYSDSNYIVWPFFGPSSFRDGVGLPVDYYFFSIYPWIDSERIRYGLYGLGVIDRRANLLNYQDVVEQAAIDKYVFLRNAYLQRRAFEIEQNQQQGIVTKNNLDE